MAQWLDRYEKHPVHGQITALDQLIGASEEIIKDVTDANVIESVERLRLIIDALKQKFKHIDPLMLPAQVLSTPNQQIQAVINQIRAFNTSRNIGHLTNANTESDGLLLTLSNILAPRSPADVDGLKDSVASLRRSAGQLNRNIEAEFNRLSEKFGSLTKQFESLGSDVAAQKSRLDNAIAQFQQQFSQAEARRSEQFEQAKDKRSGDYEKLIADIREEFDNNLQELRNTFQGTISETKESLHQLDLDLR